MLYAALGDSITYGYSASTDQRAFVPRVRAALARQASVSLYLCAKPGWTSRQLLKSISKTPTCIWDEARLVTLMVGGNDMIWAAPWLMENNPVRVARVADRLYENLSDIIRIVKRPRSTFVIATLYNPFPNSRMCEAYTDMLNKSIRLAARREGLPVADVQKAFRRREQDLIDGYRNGNIRDFRIRGNPIHPNDAGHALISRTMIATYRRALATSRAPKRKIGNRM